VRAKSVACAGVVALGLGGGLLAAPPATAVASLPALAVSKPNIVLIVADDLGYAQTSLYGRTGAISTPNLAALGDDGTRLAEGYVASPVCSPSRSALLTGEEPSDVGADSNVLTRSRPQRMPTETIAAALPTNYKSIAIGKWDLAGAAPFDADHLPAAMGFNDFYGFFGGEHSYCPPTGSATNLKQYDPTTTSYDNVASTTYLTQDFTNKAVDYIDDHAAGSGTNPFFMYLAYNAPHVPLETPTTCAGGSQSDEDRFADMVGIMDDGIGDVRSALSANGIANNTIVVFLSDNGQQTEYFTDPSVVRGGKYTLFEGGVRVPFTISWPDGLPAGATYTEPMSSMDLFPTLMDASGSSTATPVGSPGIDLMPYLTGHSSGPPHESLSWRYVVDKAVEGQEGTVVVAQRSGDMKWLRETVPPNSSSPNAVATNYLFNIETNPSESDSGNLWPNSSLSDPLLTEFNAWDSGKATTEYFKNPRSASDIRANLPDGYVEAGGTWIVVNDGAGDKAYQGTSVGSSGRSMLALSYYDDAKVSSGVTLETAGQAGLILRATGAAATFNGYVAGVAIPGDGSACAGSAPQPGGGSPRVFLSKVVNGAASVVACQDLALTVGTKYNLIVRAVGTAMSVSVNGTQQLSWTDSSSPFTGGQIGFKVSGVSAVPNAQAEFASLQAQRCSGACP
jgi:arylsulfatase A-like enzyme